MTNPRVMGRALSGSTVERDLAGAKHLALQGAVFITDRGEPTHVLLSIDDYNALANKPMRSLLNLMREIPGGNRDFEPSPIDGDLKTVNLG